jgi:hypothetical protein
MGVEWKRRRLLVRASEVSTDDQDTSTSTNRYLFVLKSSCEECERWHFFRGYEVRRLQWVQSTWFLYYVVRQSHRMIPKEFGKKHQRTFIPTFANQIPADEIIRRHRKFKPAQSPRDSSQEKATSSVWINGPQQ